MTNYVITDGSRWIMKDKKGKYVPTSSQSLAGFYTKKQADGICNSSLSKALRGIFHVEKVDIIIPEQIKPVTEKDIDKTEKVMVSENIQHWLDKVSDLNSLSNEVLSRKKELCRELSNVDKELCDILHYIEFCNLNAAQGYKAYKMVKERRILRRSIKNELLVLENILDRKVCDTTSNKINRSIQKIDKRTYEPRVLKELFDF